MELILTLVGSATFWAAGTHPNWRFSPISDFASIFRVLRLMHAWFCKLQLIFNVPEWTQQVKKILQIYIEGNTPKIYI